MSKVYVCDICGSKISDYDVKWGYCKEIIVKSGRTRKKVWNAHSHCFQMFVEDLSKKERSICGNEELVRKVEELTSKVEEYESLMKNKEVINQ